MRQRYAPVGFTIVALLGAVSLVPAQRRQASTEWQHFSGDQQSTKYSPLALIDKGNVRDLQVAWRWTSPDRQIEPQNPIWRVSKYEDTPLLIKGTLYTVTSLGIVAALDPGTGQARWTYDTEAYKRLKTRPPNGGNFSNRGMEYWTDGKAERLLLGTVDARLVSIDIKTGKPDPNFGAGGSVDTTAGIRHAVGGTNFVARRPLAAGDVVIIGNNVSDQVPGVAGNPPGYVQAYDVRTGRLLWQFHTVPLKGEFGYESWLENSADNGGNSNVWAGMTYDPELGYVYMASSTPNSDFYGGHRPGDNLFAESIICVEAKTGRRVWHFQAVHHGLWDYDFPADPVLGDITVDGKRIKAVMVTSKQAFTYVFDRKTGTPVWPIVEKPVPQSSVPRERTSPTQPHPTKPPAFDLQGSTPDNLMDFTPALRARALEQLKKFEFGPVFTPPSLKGTVFLPGVFGGGRWGGGALDPETGWFYVPSITVPSVGRATQADPTQTDLLYRASGGAPAPELFIDGLPIFKPPYSRISAFNMNKGDLQWMTPLGDGPRNHPLLKGLNVGPLGTAPQMTHVLLTKTLLFVTITYMQSSGVPARAPWAKWADADLYREVLFVFDKQNGRLLHTVKLDGDGVAQPMTYVHEGRQYILMAAGGSGTAELVALAVGAPSRTTQTTSQAGPGAAAAGTRTAASGVYTTQQAERGLTAYRRNCETCHGSQLEGGAYAPALGGATFDERWRPKTAGALFDILRLTMPEGRPGSLEAGAYADIVAYLLKMNGYAAGTSDLPFDSTVLGQISLQPKETR
jgi:quinoprotein glucose dehydrogenase